MRRLKRAYERNAKKRKKLKQRAIAAGTAAAITFGVTSAANKALAHTPDSHELPVAKDVDADFLANVEEILIGSNPINHDQNYNAIPDGVELAKLCAVDINELPWQHEALPGETYKWLIPTWGLEICDICGAVVNMGPAGIVNPKLGISVDCPLIAIHYMEHGSFSYGGDVHEGRLDVPALLKALELELPFDTNAHQLPVTPDADSDLISDNEEYAIGYQPFKPDQNRNEVLNGVELAKHCAIAVEGLPQQYQAGPNETYKMCYEVDGLERCDICGQWIHMGGCTIVNPKLGLRYPDANDPLDGEFLPDLAVHYMGHGSFDCYGHVDVGPWHAGRVDLQRLIRVLELRYPYEPNEHQLSVDGNDLDGDLLTDNEELKSALDLYDSDQDENLILDGIELARQCGEVIDALPIHGPNTPGVNEPYKADFFQRGLEVCDICGEAVNMGFWLVINPKLQLSIEVPDIVCHYMRHGSFSYSGDVHGKNRIDVSLLLKILEMPVRCGDLGTIFLPGDANKDCKEDFADFVEFANKWLESTDPNED